MKSQNKGISILSLIIIVVIVLILVVGIMSALQGNEKTVKTQQVETEDEKSESNDMTNELSEVSAAPEDVFIWKSNDPTSEDYGVVIGYTANVDNYTILRYPTRCTKITFEYDAERYGEVKDVIESRAFTNNILKIEIPRTVQSMDLNMNGYAFQKLEEIVIEDGLTTIKGYAFAGAKSLKNITIPSSITTIGWSAFQGCTSLNNITIPSSITSIGHGAFYGCTNLTKMTIPSSLKSIDDYTFSGCTGLIELKISDTITSIGNYTFRECISLRELTIPDSIVNINSYAFENCTSLKKVKIMSTSLSQVGTDAFSNMAPESEIYVLNEGVEKALSGKYTKENTTIKIVTAEEMKSL